MSGFQEIDSRAVRQLTHELNMMNLHDRGTENPLPDEIYRVRLAERVIEALDVLWDRLEEEEKDGLEEAEDEAKWAIFLRDHPQFVGMKNLSLVWMRLLASGPEAAKQLAFSLQAGA